MRAIVPPNDRRSPVRTELGSNISSLMLLTSADNKSCLGRLRLSSHGTGCQGDWRRIRRGTFSVPILSFQSSSSQEKQSGQPRRVFLTRHSPGPSRIQRRPGTEDLARRPGTKSSARSRAQEKTVESRQNGPHRVPCSSTQGCQWNW